MTRPNLPRKIVLLGCLFATYLAVYPPDAKAQLAGEESSPTPPSDAMSTLPRLRQV